MSAWFWYAVGAAVLYGAHQIFTKLAAKWVEEKSKPFVDEGAEVYVKARGRIQSCAVGSV